MNLRNRVDALSLPRMKPTILDGDDRKALGQAVGVLTIAITGLATVALSGALVLGLAVRCFQFAAG